MPKRISYKKNMDRFPSTANVFRDVAEREFSREMKTALRVEIAKKSKYPKRDLEIILKRTGLFDGEIWTYPRLSKEFKVSETRIRSICLFPVRRVLILNPKFRDIFDKMVERRSKNREK